MGSKDSWLGFSVSKKSIREHITPHKISVVLLIQEYCIIKFEAIEQAKENSNVMKVPVALPEPYYRRDFCMLILYLIQCPDMDYKELINLLESGKYKIVPNLIKNFLTEIEGFINEEVGKFMDLIHNLGRLLIDPVNMTVLVNKSSPIGIYLRRVMLYFDKLSFSQTISLFRSYQHYVKLGKPPLVAKAETSVIPEEDSISLLRDMDSISMDIASTSELVVPPADSLVEDMKLIQMEDEGEPEEVPPLWSRRQAELFIARQTNWLQNNESAALPAPRLQEVIRQLLQANPDHYEAHYLSYLNCLRVKEFNGAVDSLYHFFDRNTSTSQDKEGKGYRYAALNLAILHAQFGHKKESLAALKEAIFLSHEVNDNVCLQHAQAWLYKLTEENKEILMERSISKCSDMSLNYLTSLGLQSFAQFAGTTGGKPALVFEVLMRSDVLNCQFSMLDLMAHSFTHKAALWSLYGKADMATLSSQLLLHLDTSESQALNCYSGEATCQAVCNMAIRLTDLGEYDMAMVVVEHAKDRFPGSTSWQLAEQLLYFTRSLYRCQWQAAHTAVRQLAAISKWEAFIREGELLLAKGDNAGGLAAVTHVLDGGPTLCPSVRVRALLLAAKASQAAAVSILTAALSIANYHYLDYLTALVAMQLAQVQLEMNLPNQALKLMDQSLLVVLSHGGHYDQAMALMQFVQCKVASVATAEAEVRNEVIADGIRLLSKVKEDFHHMEAFTMVKGAVYLQCQLANELGFFAERNKFAYEFRQLDEEFPTLQHV